MQIKNRPEKAAVQERYSPDTTPVIQIKPVSKNEAFATLLLKQPRGVNALDTNARSVDDFDQIGTGAKFYTTCLHSDVSKFRNQHGVDIAGENERYQSRHGYSAHFTRYRLPDRNAALRIVTLINRWRAERGAASIPAVEAQHLINQFPDTTAA
ncbi:hypothetical protein GNG27_04890 [Leclercia sp. 119287]|uniref:hypothetical protein n=1 Tax=Leclercia sp. 119287 TaxID=2681308 RepID=UPI0012E0CB81|nr:hypothetical protein [Leclercia sp. 119287]QGU14023.1 hypothetical protein GNG27_04890 [Leclercia sp. 119287]